MTRDTGSILSALVAGALVLTGCFDATDPVQFSCSDEHPTCPTGQVCKGGKCVAPSSVDDAAVDAPTPDSKITEDAPVSDSPPADGPTGDAPIPCGNGAIDTGEDCDGQKLGGETCSSQGFHGGTLTCDQSCKFDLSLCTNCGNDTIDTGEDCDGTALGGTCKTLGFDSGQLACTKACKHDTSGCTYATCNDGTANSNEDCDKTDLKGQQCSDLGFTGGTLACNTNCTFNTSGCYKCGDNKVNGPTGVEKCDGTDMSGKTCVTQGFEGGTLKCTAVCTFDASSCYKCGDGLINGPGEVCDGSNVGTNTCSTLNYEGGTLLCASDCKSLVTDNCYKCGDGKINGPSEQCDTAALGGKTCVALGFQGGTLVCSNTCTFDTSGCYKCGDNKVNGPGESCDGVDLGGKSCASFGFGGGTLGCTSSCTFNKAKCETAGYVGVPAGTFTMGSPDTEPCRTSYDDREKAHKVTLTHPFEISVTETTQSQFQAAMGYNPSTYTSCGTSCPVETLSWYEMQAYCNKLSVARGLTSCYSCSGTQSSTTCSTATAYSGTKIYSCPGYRLPTEAEWEYAYRAGTQTAYYNGPNDPNECLGVDPNAGLIGWYTKNAGSTTHPAKQKSPNKWGLYDMAGNVSERCHDFFKEHTTLTVTDPVNVAGSHPSGDYLIGRGGQGGGAASTLRGAAKSSGAITGGYKYTGFRCVRTQ